VCSWDEKTGNGQNEGGVLGDVRPYLDGATHCLDYGFEGRNFK